MHKIFCQQMTEETKKFSENDRIFYGDGYRLAQSFISEGLSNQSMFAAIESLYSTIDDLNNSVTAFAERQNMKVACFKGCHWCCHQAVFANSYELHFLSEHINKNFNPEELEGLAKRSAQKHAVTSKLDESDILNYKWPCPLLKDGSCSVYSARPVACRIYLSTNQESCLEFYHHPAHETHYPQLLYFPLRAGKLMNEGFRAALKEAGVETSEFRLEEGLSILFRN